MVWKIARNKIINITILECKCGTISESKTNGSNNKYNHIGM